MTEGAETSGWQGILWLAEGRESRAWRFHREGDAWWTPRNRRSHVGRSGFGLARRDRTRRAGRWHGRADQRAVGGSGRDQAAPSRSRSGSGDPWSGGDAGRWRRVRLWSWCGPSAERVVRERGVWLDSVQDGRPDRLHPRTAGRGPSGSRAGTGSVLEAARRAAAVDAWCRCDADHGALGEGEGGRELQGRLRVSSVAGLPWWDARGARRAAQTGERRVEHRRGSQDGDRPGAGADPGRVRRLAGDPDPRGLRRCDARPDRLLPWGEHAVLGRLWADRAGPLGDPRDSRGRVGCRVGPGRFGARERRGRWDHRPSGSHRLGWGGPADQTDRAARASAPRRATLLHRSRRIPLPSDPDRPDRPGHRRDRVPPPPARACWGPHPWRQGHRPVQVPVQRLRAQRGLASDRDARARRARLDPSARSRRNAGQGRAQARPLQAAARRWPARVLRPSREAPPPEHVALGHRAQGGLRAAQSAPSRHRLTQPPATTSPSKPSGHGRDHRCPHTGRPRLPVPRNRPVRPRSRPTTPHSPRATASRVPLSHSHTPTARSGLALSATGAFVALSASGASGRSSLPTTSNKWDPQTTNVPYLAWAGEQVRLEKCFVVPVGAATVPDLSGVNATFQIEDWSGDPNFKPTVEDGSNGTGSGTVGVFWSRALGELCARGDLISLYPGMARVELDIIDANDVLQFFGWDPGVPVIKHQFLAGWMTLNTPTLSELSASSFASTAQSEAAAEMGDPSGNGQFDAGIKPGYLDVSVTGSIPMNGAWQQLLGQSSVTLPGDWALLASKLATNDVVGGDPVSQWDIMNDPVNVLSHVPQSPTPCSPVPSQFASVPAGAAGTDTVDDCTGGGADGPFSTQFGVLSSGSTIGPFDPVDAADTLLPNGVLDWADAPMPAARVDVLIAQNSGGATDTSGVGDLAPADKDKTYSRDFLGSKTDTLPYDEYAPFYDQYIPATTRPVDASSGIDGGVANNFNGFLVDGLYHNWDFAATLGSNESGVASDCLRSTYDPMIGGAPSDYYQLPSGAYSVAVYTDNHGEAQVQYVPGEGFYFDSLVAQAAAAGTPITNADGGCDLQYLYKVPGGLGAASITATARYPYKPVDFPDMTSAPVMKSVASLWSKTITAYPKGTGTENANARIVTTHAQGIDGTPFAGETVCFAGDQNSEGIGVFQGTVGGYSYAGVQPASYPYAPSGSTCVTSDANGNAAVEVLNSNATKVDVVATFENEGILRDITVDFSSGGAGTTTTITPTTTTTKPAATTTTTTTTTVTTVTEATPTGTSGTSGASTSGSGAGASATVVPAATGSAKTSGRRSRRCCGSCDSSRSSAATTTCWSAWPRRTRPRRPDGPDRADQARQTHDHQTRHEDLPDQGQREREDQHRRLGHEGVREVGVIDNYASGL